MAHRICTIKEIQPLIEDIQKERYFSGNAFMEFFRGHATNRYKLLPGIFRYSKTIGELKIIEKKLICNFNEEVNKGNIVLQESFLKDKYPYSHIWIKLFQAQHLGLKTRLLDWTIDLEMALLFAVDNENLHGKDGQLWIFKCPKEYQINDGQKENILMQAPMEIDNSYMINFPFFIDKDYEEITAERRRARQHGRFSIQPIEKGITPIEEQKEFQPFLTEFIIDRNSKAKIKRVLENMGLNIDWAFYRRENDVDRLIKNLNAGLLEA